ncbi:MAG: DUF4843 domain-containing protein, partial [Bacteroidia bacterium]
VKDTNGNIDWPRTSLATSNVKCFGFELDTNSQRIKDFDKIVKLAEHNNWNLIFNLMPENLENARKLVGNDLAGLMLKNKNKLVERYTQKGVQVVDNFNIVAHELFIDKDFPTEHYAQKGRKAVAANVATAIKTIHPNAYVQLIDTLTGKQKFFFHNGEKDEVWGQMQTLTHTRAFSGTKASEFGASEPFSLTFDYPFSQISDSTKNTIDISFQFWIEQKPEDLNLIVEFSGKNTEFSWNPIPIDSITTLKLGAWTEVNYRFSIKPSVKNADIIKIYLYNTTSQKTFIDDLKVHFK